MARMPGTLTVGRQVYTIVNDAEGWSTTASGDLGLKHQDHGATNHHRLLLCINPHDNPYQQADTLLHELLHIVWFMGGMDTAGTQEAINEREEDVIARLTPWLLLALAENPGVQAFLENPEG